MNAEKHNSKECKTCPDVGCDAEKSEKHLKSKDDFNLRPEASSFELGAKKVLWIFFAICFGIFLLFASENGEPVVRKDSMAFLKMLANWLIASSHSGSTALIDFLSTHLISAMVPAFFLAAAISTFFSKETIIMAIGKKSNPLTSYPLAAFAGAILTVCSCGVLPIFMSLLQSGAGLGPAITFLYASPAINLISIIYTWKIIPSMLVARIFAVAICAIAIGLLMQKIFANMPDEFESEELKIKPSKRKAWQEGAFFVLLVLIMLTSTDLFSGFTDHLIPGSWFASRGEDVAIKTAHLAGKLLAILVEIIFVVVALRLWFTWDDTRKWLKRTGRQARSIMPMVVLGIFFSGFLGGTSALVSSFSVFSDNTIFSNLAASFIGAMLYFGSIVGVNVVDLFMRWGMHHGPAMALLLAGPSISLPSVLALAPIMGKYKTAVFLGLVVIFTTIVGLLFGAFGSAV
ncbi:MAG: permease [Candidatus Riflebacteria bacterium]|nr:permease [Candidatus Riflebacteria bacterium]